MIQLSAEYLRSILHYDPETGIWTWITSRPGVTVGSRAGAGYAHRMIGIDGKRYFESRLAWLYMTEEWPKELVDHEDRDPSNGKWSNLRLATRSQNQMNSGARKNNILGVKGVSRHNKGFRVMITVDRKPVYLGTFVTLEEAVAVYTKAAHIYYGEFACV